MEWHLDKKIIDFGFDDEDTIVIDWNDGRRSAFDPYPYMKGAMEKLLDEDYLKLAYLTGYGRGIAWPGNLDFASLPCGGPLRSTCIASGASGRTRSRSWWGPGRRP